MVLPSERELPYEFGPYRLVRVLGEGGMARVYLGEKGGRAGFTAPFAVKIVRRKAGKKSEFRKLLTREALIGHYLDHPNIVAMRDFDEIDGHLYIAMDYVRGTNLESLMEAASRQGRDFPPLLALDLCQQLCWGLGYAHSLCDAGGKHLRIIHRDIKPANILVSNHGHARLTDFGIAKAAVETGVVTATNVVRGTPLYMSPEQAMGRALDHRSDLFAVGLILYELLLGRRLFEMRDIVSTMESIARAQIGSAPEDLDAVVPGLGPVFRRLMALQPASRHADANELAADLARLSMQLLPGADRATIDAELKRSREELKTTTERLALDVESGRRPRVPTEPDTRPRIPVGLDEFDHPDSGQVRELQDRADKHRRDQPADIDRSAETLPWTAPVLRRTSQQLKALLIEAEEAASSPHAAG